MNMLKTIGTTIAAANIIATTDTNIFLPFLLDIFIIKIPPFFIWRHTFMKLLLPLVILILFLINHNIKRTSRIDAAKRDSFWENEAKANRTRKVNIDNLDYIVIPIDTLPFLEKPKANDAIIGYQNTILELKDKKILNLTGYTNTQLKEMYGAANLDFLSSCDANYTKLVSTLSRLGQELINLSLCDEAVIVLELGIEFKTDVSQNYYLLANEYIRRNETYKIPHLIDVASSIKSISKDAIIDRLESYRN